jgi:uncharacterized membrane protein
MTWAPALIGCAIVLLVLCIGICAVCALRDRSLRGTRISNEEIQRERITLSLPNFAMKDFKDR